MSTSYAFVATMTVKARVILLHQLLGHPGIKALSRALDMGEYAAWDLTSSDVRKTDLSQCVGCLRGKMVSGRRSIAAPSRVLPHPKEPGSDQHVDILFFDYKGIKRMGLLSTDGATGFIRIGVLASRARDDLLHAVRNLFNFWFSVRRGLEIPTGFIKLHCDGESSIMALQRDGSLERLGFRLSPVAAGVHERKAERGIRTTKDHVRCTIYGSPTPIPGELLPDALEWTVLGLNQTANENTDGRTPWSIIYNEKVSGNHFSVPFGTLVLAHDPMTRNSLRPKSQFGIVVGREEISRAVKVYLFGEHDSSERRVRRDAFQIISPPYAPDVQALISRLAPLGTIPIDNVDDWLWLESERASRLTDHPPPTGDLPNPSTVSPEGNEDTANQLEHGPSSVPTQDNISSDFRPDDEHRQSSTLHGDSNVFDPSTDDASHHATPNLIATAQPENGLAADTRLSVQGVMTQARLPIQGVMTQARLPIQGVMTRARTARLELTPAPSPTNSPSQHATNGQDSTLTVPETDVTRPVKRIQLASAAIHEGSFLAAYFLKDNALTAEGVDMNDIERHVLHESANGSPHESDYHALLASKLNAAAKITDSWNRTAVDFDLGRAGLAAFLSQIDMDHEALACMAAQRAPMVLSSNHLSPSQKQAFMKELHQLTTTYDAFEGVDLNSLSQYDTDHAIPTVTLVSTKYFADGAFDKWKARLVTKGFADVGNSGDTSSPTVSSELVTVALNYAVSSDLDIDIMDVGAAFLEATLDRNVYVRIAKDSADEIVKLKPQLNSGRLENGDLILRLKRALYGLRDSPRAWYDTLSKVLIQLGFTRSELDPCLFFKFTDDQPHLVLTHVDDIMSTGPRQSMTELRVGLKKAFQEVKMNINPCSFGYLGCHLERDRKRKLICIRQTKHIEALLDRLGDEVSIECETPCNERLFHVMNDRPLNKQASSNFASIVMTMLYITKTRPDIKCPVIFLSTRLTKATVDDYYKMLRVARYLKRTKHLPSVISASDMQLRGSADASHGVHPDCKSHTGGLLWFGKCNAPVVVISRKQTLVTRSSTTAEIVALDTVAVEAVWVRDVLKEVHLDKGPVSIQQDNQACILMVKRGYPSKGSHAVDVRLHYTKSKIDDSVIELKEVRTNHLLADGLTKSLPVSKFFDWCATLLNLRALKSH